MVALEDNGACTLRTFVIHILFINMQIKSQILIDDFTFAMMYKGVSLDRMSYLRNLSNTTRDTLMTLI